MKIRITNQSFIYENDVLTTVIVKYDITNDKAYISGDYRISLAEYVANVLPEQQMALIVKKLKDDFTAEFNKLNPAPPAS
ncbi:hypothetical protein PQE68_gp261 [Bacillus phage vB_BanS_Sophrita]|uniref:Uncharacterized protein n=1 Tax=Bacillus phage vB_BanS_Sophrita TaxID=2894790 RepID=A0AAE9CE80_9CAUD|nr:hypothetical protein PQE68_gp261 [Bacillus phage vB_BanS_Sophrita]UGO50821.1 hypothetical protein SOPHRITA_234 [Bacillus phage vB_BanS_Sophrita]